MIDTREELIIALSEAAEIEHGLLVQYLFAAFSMKRGNNGGLLDHQQLMVDKWQETILNVAQQEMIHLATVCNLLSAIGGAPNFRRPNFPQPNRSSFDLGVGNDDIRHFYYPFDFELEKFNDCSLYRFIISELPKGEPPPIHPRRFCKPAGAPHSLLAINESPDPLVYNHVGELYGLIKEGFRQLLKRMHEDELFIGGKKNQDDDKVKAVTDLQSALTAIDEIVEEGEGAKDNRSGSHYSSFIQIREELCRERTKYPAFEPAKNLVKNPQTRVNRDSGGKVSLIEHEVTKALAELFNDIYTTMLMILIQYYSFFSDDTVSQRNTLKGSSRGMMSALVRPIAEMLTEMPMTKPENPEKAGPCFEIYSPVNLSPHADNRWSILKERFLQQSDACQFLLKFANQFPVLDRLNEVNENITYILYNLETAFKVK